MLEMSLMKLQPIYAQIEQSASAGCGQRQKRLLRQISAWARQLEGGGGGEIDQGAAVRMAQGEKIRMQA